MGTTFNTCKVCEDPTSEHDYAYCNTCEEVICNWCAPNVNDDGELDEENCPLCKMDHIPDDELLAFLLENYTDMTREELITEYKVQKILNGE